MNQYRDFEMQQQSIARGPKQNAIQCKTCKCEWFEQVKVQKIDMNTICTLGQMAPEDSSLAYGQILLRCIKCNDLQELPLNISSAHKDIQNSYFELTKTLEESKEK